MKNEKKNRDAPGFDVILKEFQAAVESNDKKKILSMTQFPFFYYDNTTENILILKHNSKEGFFKIDIDTEFFGGGYHLLDNKDPNRKQIIKTKKYNIYKPNEYLDLFYSIPAFKNQILIEVPLNKNYNGIQGLLFIKKGDKYLYAGYYDVCYNNI